MTIPQLSVPDDYGSLVSGQVASTGPHRFVSRVSTTDEAIFGRVAFQLDTDPEGWTDDDDTGNNNPIGIIVFTHALPTAPASILPSTGDVAANMPINIMTQGTIRATTVLAVTNLNDDVVSFAAATGAISTTGTALVGAKFLSLAGAGEVVTIGLNIL